MQRTIGILALVALLVMALGMPACAAEKPAAKIKVLVITGDDVSAHAWREISEATRDALVSAGKFDVKVCEDPLILESATALNGYDAIVFLIYTRANPNPSDLAKENLLGFVKSGKGFFVQHLASASFSKWEDFGKLCGLYWVMGKSGHGPRSTFEVKIADKEHPITRGMKDFQADDELYAKLQGAEAVHVLVTADSDWSKKTEPLLFTKEFGKGRVVYNAFGHDGKALANPSVRQIIARGVEWAATGKVGEEK